MFDFLGPLFGRLHPLLVHLPIGILVFGILLCFLPQREKNTFLPAIRLAFLLGGIAASAAGISGFLQYQFEGFPWEDVRIHLIAGVITALGSFGLYFHLRKNDAITHKSKIFALGLGLVLTITGHLGGSLTHGSTYFTEVLPPELQSFLGVEIKPEKGPQLAEENWEEAVLYTEVIQPILNQKLPQSTKQKRRTRPDYPKEFNGWRRRWNGVSSRRYTTQRTFHKTYFAKRR
jgi:uncharacterized membrane protein